MFATDIEAHSNNHARIDGILFGPSGGEQFCRRGLNSGDNTCVSGHDELIDRYLHGLGSIQSKLPARVGGSPLAEAEPASGILSGTQLIVWESSEGGSSSVQSPPVKLGEYSCMSLYLDPPNAQGAEVSFRLGFEP